MLREMLPGMLPGMLPRMLPGVLPGLPFYKITFKYSRGGGRWERDETLTSGMRR